MKKWYKKTAAGAVIAGALCAAAGGSAIASKQPAAVVRGNYDFSDMTVRRVWFNADDPVFLIDDYDRVWADQNVNAVGYGDVSQAGINGNLMVPMKEMFRQIGGSYSEDGNRIVIGLNGDTLELKIGSRDVAFNGQKIENALTEEQKPVRVNQKDNGYNTFLDEDYYVTYLPAAYVLNKFQADVYTDSNVQSLYAAVPIFNSEQVPSLETAAKGYGIRFDDILNGTAAYSHLAVDNVISIQNEDGGFSLLPDNTDMEQEGLAGRRGTLADTSTLERGVTAAMLDYLADAVENGDATAAEPLTKGIQYLLGSQSELGGWQMSPSDPEGFRGNVVFTDHITTDILRLLRRIGSEDALQPVAQEVGTDRLRAAVDKGDQFILASQLTFGSEKTGWASQYKTDGTPTMGRTYERESVSAIETADIAEYLMDAYGSGNSAVKAAVDAAAAWLEEVKIRDKEAVVIQDFTMQNGFDIFLLGSDEPGVLDTSYADDGLGTWAANYQYVDGSFIPLYSDVDPERPNQKSVNEWNAVDSDDLIWYATRTTVTYYDNDLADELLAEYSSWADPAEDNGGETAGAVTTDARKGRVDSELGILAGSGYADWQKGADGWRFQYVDGSYAMGEMVNTAEGGMTEQPVWEKIDGVWYCFGADGYAKTGITYDPAQDGWFYLDETGGMETGWQRIGENWYYFNTSSDGSQGRMAVDTRTPDGYYVDSRGIWDGIE